VVNSVVSLVYYVGIARAMFFEPLREPVRPLRPGALASIVAVASSAGVFAVGIYPPLLTHFPAVSTLIGR